MFLPAKREQHYAGRNQRKFSEKRGTGGRASAQNSTGEKKLVLEVKRRRKNVNQALIKRIPATGEKLRRA